MNAFAFVFAIHFGAASPQPTDKWLSVDKAKHFFTSVFVESASYSALRTARVSRTDARITAAALTAALGVGKEWYDSKGHGTPSGKDLVADGAGIVAAAVLLNQTPR